MSISKELKGLSCLFMGTLPFIFRSILLTFLTHPLQSTLSLITMQQYCNFTQGKEKIIKHRNPIRILYISCGKSSEQGKEKTKKPQNLPFLPWSWSYQRVKINIWLVWLMTWKRDLEKVILWNRERLWTNWYASFGSSHGNSCLLYWNLSMLKFRKRILFLMHLTYYP